VERVVDDLLNGKLRNRSINQNLTKSGRIITCEWNNSPLHGTDGKIIGAMSLALDITKRKHAEETLCKRDATLDSLFKAAPTGIGLVSDRVFKRINERICEMTGYSEDELLEKSAEMLYPDREEYERVGREKYSQINTCGIGTVETRWKCKDGRIIDILLSSTPIQTDDMKDWITFTAMDITERKRAEQELRESKDRYRRITEAITDYIYTVRVKDGQALETVHGPASAAVTGYTAEDFQENPYLWIQMVHPEDRRLVEQQAKEALSGAKTPPLEHRIIRKDGVSRWAKSTLVLNFDRFGHLVSYDGLVQDVTERKKAEEALRRAHDELEAFNVELEEKVRERTEELRKKNRQLVEAEKLAALGQMANTVAHELRNPLTAVGGFARRISKNMREDDPNKKYLEMVVEKVLTMEQKVSEITKLGKFQKDISKASS
jgi:PAS domain S-box-containing protein